MLLLEERRIGIGPMKNIMVLYYLSPNHFSFSKNTMKVRLGKTMIHPKSEL